MAMETASDFDSYLDASFGHGIAVTYTPNGQSSKSINIILNQEYVDIDNGSVAVEGYQPIATIKTTDVAGIAHGDVIAVPNITDLSGNVIKSATSFKVINLQNDNTGITQALLEEQ